MSWDGLVFLSTPNLVFGPPPSKISRVYLLWQLAVQNNRFLCSFSSALCCCLCLPELACSPPCLPVLLLGLLLPAEIVSWISFLLGVGGLLLSQLSGISPLYIPSALWWQCYTPNLFLSTNLSSSQPCVLLPPLCPTSFLSCCCVSRCVACRQPSWGMWSVCHTIFGLDSCNTYTSNCV